MARSVHTHVFVFALLLLTVTRLITAQVVTATLATGTDPWAIAVNHNTNKAYVVNKCISSGCQTAGTITVIDGATNATSSVTVGLSPYAVALNSNPSANKIYVVNHCGNDPNCASRGTVTVVDGATNNTVATVTVGYYPYAVAVNETTNQAYVVNYCGENSHCQASGTVTVIDANNNYSTASVNVGYQPVAVAIDSMTNKAYTVDGCGSPSSCQSGGTSTVIDGNNNYSTTTVHVGFHPHDIDVNEVTNKIYVSNSCGNDFNCQSQGTVTVIDGASNQASSVNVGYFPNGIAVNETTNNIYVANQCGNDVSCHSLGTVTVIAGATNSTSAVSVGAKPHSVAVDSQRNRIYVTDFCGNDLGCHTAAVLTVIDGVTGNTSPVAIGDGPTSIGIYQPGNVIFVTNGPDNSVSVIGGDSKLQLLNVTPCRLVDTRSGGPISGGTFQSFNLPQLAQAAHCANLNPAAAYSLNVTLVPVNGVAVRYLTIWPASQIQPIVSLMNSPDARVKANAAIVPAGVNGAVSVYVTDTANVIIDIDGFFAPAGLNTLEFYPLTPCRVADTRSDNYPGGLGSPHLFARQARDFPSYLSTCQIPMSAKAYSLNLTAVAYPGQGSRLGYLEVWPTGQQPANPVSTLNNPTGTNVANAAIVPAGDVGGNGEITVYPSDDTDLLIDIDGYFAPAGQGGYSLYPTPPCRVIDTRQIGNGQPFNGTLSPPVNVSGSSCAPPSTAQGYVFNATVVPSGTLYYLTLWPDGETMPVVSTLNANDGRVTSNMAIVPNFDNHGKTDAYAAGTTQLVLDISSYFAP